MRFSAPVGVTWQLEAADSLSPGGKWTAIGDPVAGDDYFHEKEDILPVLGERYYRLRAVVE